MDHANVSSRLVKDEIRVVHIFGQFSDMLDYVQILETVLNNSPTSVIIYQDYGRAGR